MSDRLEEIKTLFEDTLTTADVSRCGFTFAHAKWLIAEVERLRGENQRLDIYQRASAKENVALRADAEMLHGSTANLLDRLQATESEVERLRTAESIVLKLHAGDFWEDGTLEDGSSWWQMFADSYGFTDAEIAYIEVLLAGPECAAGPGGET